MEANVELVNGHVAPTPDGPVYEPPRRYVLTPKEQRLFLQYREAAGRIEASMQGAMQLILSQQGLESPRGFRLEQDCTALVEQI